MTVETQEQLEKLKKIGVIVADCLKHMLSSIEDGITTKELDDIGKSFLDKHGAQSAPYHCYQFPGTTCISINNEAAHGIPSHRKIKAGDLVNIDVSAERDGYFGDTGASILFRSQDKTMKQLCQATKKALQESIKYIKAPTPLNTIGKSIEKIANKEGFTIVRNLCSHGIGRSLHEDPEEILGFYNRNDRRTIHEGMAFTIEPFLSNGSKFVKELEDGWTLAHPKGFYSAQYEHSLVATKNGPIILTLPSKGAPFVPYN